MARQEFMRVKQLLCDPKLKLESSHEIGQVMGYVWFVFFIWHSVRDIKLDVINKTKSI